MCLKTGDNQDVDVRFRQSLSLAARLTAWYAISAFLLVVVVSAFLYFALSGYLEAEDDDLLQARIEVISDLLRGVPHPPSLQKEVDVKGVPYQYNYSLVRIRNEKGEIVAATTRMDSLLDTDEFPEPGIDHAPKGFNLQSRRGEPFRAMSARVKNENGTFVIDVAISEAAEFELLAGYRNKMWTVLALAFVACFVGGFWIARSGLRPVRDFSKTVRSIHATTLDRRVRRDRLPGEIDHLAATFNKMLGRLENAFERLAGFSADIAHELRTPVNVLRGEIEVVLTRARSAEEYRAALGSSLEECLRLTRLIDNLLFLARAENPRTSISKLHFDASDELAKICDYYEPLAAESGIRLVAGPGIGGSVTIHGDRVMFQRAMGNLLDNAIRYTPSGGKVVVSVSTRDRATHVEVADTGLGIPESHLPLLFDRFHRREPDRSRVTGGVGLGLSITRSIVLLHGGQIKVDSSPGKGTRFSMVFPVASSESETHTRQLERKKLFA